MANRSGERERERSTASMRLRPFSLFNNERKLLLNVIGNRILPPACLDAFWWPVLVDRSRANPAVEVEQEHTTAVDSFGRFRAAGWVTWHDWSDRMNEREDWDNHHDRDQRWIVSVPRPKHRRIVVQNQQRSRVWNRDPKELWSIGWLVSIGDAEMEEGKHQVHENRLSRKLLEVGWVTMVVGEWPTTVAKHCETDRRLSRKTDTRSVRWKSSMDEFVASTAHFEGRRSLFVRGNSSSCRLISNAIQLISLLPSLELCLG